MRGYVVAATVVAMSAVLAGSALSGSRARDYAPLDSNAEPLRSAFNADVGKVRVLMLVAPT